MIDYENLFRLNRPFFEEYKSSFADVLASGWFVLGQQVQEFETEFAHYCRAQNCVGVANGMDALLLGLKIFNFEKGSEILVPSNTYIATILAILHAGLKPVLVEPNLQTYNIDPNLLKNAITPKSRAVMIVHLYGKPCEMTAITQICEKYKLPLIEDCAQAHGAKFDGQHVGTFGDVGAFSFYPTKNLGALGDAGGVILKDSRYLQDLKRLRNYGSDVKYHNEVVGHNSRLDEVQAAFLRIKLRSLDTINLHKRKLALLYLQNLKSDFILPTTDPATFDVYHIFNIRHEKRDQLKAYLEKKEIKTEIHYPVAPHRQKALEGLFGVQEYPISEKIHRTTLSLPISFYHSVEDISKVIDALNGF